MKQPRTSIMITGYPLVAVPAIAVCGFVVFLALMNGDFGWPLVIPLVLGSWFANCMKVANQYRAWRRDWDALDPNHQPQRPLRAVVRAIMAVLVVFGSLWLFANYNDPASPAHVIAPTLVVGLPLLWIVSLFLRRKRRHGKTRDWFVTQALSRPLPAPSVAEAFARLPDYCRPQSGKDLA